MPRNAIILLLFSIIILPIPICHGEPVSGTNGEVTMSVYSTLVEGNCFYVDIAAPGGYFGTTTVVSDNGTIFEQDPSKGPNSGPGKEPSRYSLEFIVPYGTLVDHITFIPDSGKEFSISLVKQIVSGTTTIDVQGTNINQYSKEAKQQYFDLLIKNAASEALNLNMEDFSYTDQEGWRYTSVMGVNPTMGVPSGENPLGTVPPNGQALYTLKFSKISTRSEPQSLTYKDQTVSI